MKTNTLVLILASGLTLYCNAAAADKAEVRDAGRREYRDSCAVCHGEQGRGDGMGVEFLKRTPSDLTTLARRNGGVFPVDRVYALIDGREAVKEHGSRDMPIWGRAYNTQTVKAAEYYVDMSYDMESYARSRILALIDYLNRLQVK